MAMTVPARTGSAADIRRILAGPRAPGWADVRRDMIARAAEVVAAVTAMCGAPGDGRAADLAERAIAELRECREVAGCADFGEAVIEAERALAVQEFLAAAGPRRLRPVP